MSTLYPLKFTSIFKERIWGGTKLRTVLNKSAPKGYIGESWELSDVEGDTSVVSNGVFKDDSIKELLKRFKGQLIGDKNYDLFGDKFPLLIKFIDAREDLSIQLHPNDELANTRHNAFGKTEMWYVLESDKDASIIVDFKKGISKQDYLEHLENKSLPSIMNVEKVKKGEAFFIDVGRVHSIGAGVLVAEIQQTSDITYRVYDWDRVDVHGNSRELHAELAMDAIDFNMADNFKKSYSEIKNTSNKIVSCQYFTTNFLPIDGIYAKKNNHDSFIIYICLEGHVEIAYNGISEPLKKGDTLLMPAALKTFEILGENATLLEVYV